MVGVIQPCSARLDRDTGSMYPKIKRVFGFLWLLVKVAGWLLMMALAHSASIIVFGLLIGVPVGFLCWVWAKSDSGSEFFGSLILIVIAVVVALCVADEFQRRRKRKRT